MATSIGIWSIRNLIFQLTIDILWSFRPKGRPKFFLIDLKNKKRVASHSSNPFFQNYDNIMILFIVLKEWVWGKAGNTLFVFEVDQEKFGTTFWPERPQNIDSQLENQVSDWPISKRPCAFWLTKNVNVVWKIRFLINQFPNDVASSDWPNKRTSFGKSGFWLTNFQTTLPFWLTK